MPFGGLLTAIALGASVGGGVLGGITGSQNQDWLHGALGTVLANLQNEGVQPGQNIFNQFSSGLQGPALNNINSSNNQLFGQNGNGGLTQQLGTNMGNFQQSLPQLLQMLSGSGGQISSLGQDSQKGLGSAAANLNNPLMALEAAMNPQGSQNTSNLAGQGFASGGWTPQSQQGFDQISKLLSGSIPGMQNVAPVADQTLANRGGTQYNLQSQGLANNVASSGGWIPQLNMGLGPTQNILNNGGNTAQSNSLSALANAIFGNGGQSQQSGMLTGAGQNVLNGNMGVSGLTSTGAQGEQTALGGLQNQGATPGTNAIQQIALQLAQHPGTSTTQGLQSQGLNLLNNPNTPYSQGAQAQGLNLINKPALMTPEQMSGMAREQAGTDFQGNAQAAYQQALRRGGGPGTLSGNQNEGMLDFADQKSKAQSDAATNALLQLQQLQLQQQQQGTNMINTGGSLANQVMGQGISAAGTGGSLQNQSQQTGLSGAIGGANAQQSFLNDYSNLLGSMEGTAANRFGTGVGAIGNAGALQNALLGIGTGAQGQSGQLANSLLGTGLGNVNSMTNAASNYVSPYVQLGLGAANNQLGNLTEGGSLAGLTNQSQLGGLGALTSLLGNQNQYALGLGGLQNSIQGTQGGLANSMAGTQGNILNNLFGTGIQGGQLGLGQFQGLTGATNTSQGNQLSLGSLLNSLMQTGFNPMTSLSGQGINIWNTGLGGQSSLFGNNGNTTQSPWLGLTQNTGGGKAATP